MGLEHHRSLGCLLHIFRQRTHRHARSSLWNRLRAHLNAHREHGKRMVGGAKGHGIRSYICFVGRNGGCSAFYPRCSSQTIWIQSHAAGLRRSHDRFDCPVTAASQSKTTGLGSSQPGENQLGLLEAASLLDIRLGGSGSRNWLLLSRRLLAILRLHL